MKKLIVIAFVGVWSFNVNAQKDAQKELICKSYKDAIDKNVKLTENPKQNAKSATWVKLAESYIEHALQCGTDSTASLKAYQTFLKAQEVEKAAGGKKSKEIEDAIYGTTNVYRALLSQGASYYNNKNLAMASQLFGLSLKVNAKDTTAALYAGIVDQSIGKNAEAVLSFNSYIANGGKDPAVFYSLAQIFKIDKNYDKAIAILRKGSELNPKDKDLKAEIVNTYLVSNNVDGAIADLEKIIESDPTNVTSLSNLGLLYDNKAQEAASEIKKIKEKITKVNTDDAHKKVDQEKLKLGDFENEIVNLNAKLKKDPKTAVATKKRIIEVTAQKDAQKDALEKAIKDLADKEAAKILNAPSADGLAALEAKNKVAKEKANAVYTKVLAIDPNNYDVNFNMAVMYFNEAVETKTVLDGMDMKEYQRIGKDLEKITCAQFLKSKPYFDKCKSIRSDDDGVNENLKNLERILEQCK